MTWVKSDLSNLSQVSFGRLDRAVWKIIVTPVGWGLSWVEPTAMTVMLAVGGIGCAVGAGAVSHNSTMFLLWAGIAVLFTTTWYGLLIKFDSIRRNSDSNRPWYLSNRFMIAAHKVSIMRRIYLCVGLAQMVAAVLAHLSVFFVGYWIFGAMAGWVFTVFDRTPA